MDVEVDVAYVHRRFGSREKLFLEAMEIASEPIDFSGGAREDIGAYLAGRQFDERRVELFSQLKERLPDPDGSCVALMLALILGFGVLRDFLRLPAVTAMESVRAQAILAQTIEQLIIPCMPETEPDDE